MSVMQHSSTSAQCRPPTVSSQVLQEQLLLFFAQEIRQIVQSRNLSHWQATISHSCCHFCNLLSSVTLFLFFVRAIFSSFQIQRLTETQKIRYSATSLSH